MPSLQFRLVTVLIVSLDRLDRTLYLAALICSIAAVVLLYYSGYVIHPYVSSHCSSLHPYVHIMSGRRHTDRYIHLHI